MSNRGRGLKRPSSSNNRKGKRKQKRSAATASEPATRGGHHQRRAATEAGSNRGGQRPLRWALASSRGGYSPIVEGPDEGGRHADADALKDVADDVSHRRAHLEGIRRAERGSG